MNKLFLIPLLLVAMNLSAQTNIVSSLPSDSTYAAIDSSAVLNITTLNQAAIDSAAVAQDVSAAKEILSGTVDINTTDDDGATVLMLAAKDNQIRTVVILISKGAKINATDNSGQTALDYAGDNTVIKMYLVKKGAVSGKKKSE